MPDKPMDPRVDAYIEKAAPYAQPVLAHLRKLMHQACPRVTESMKWGMPFFLLQGVILCHMAAFKKHCAFGFWGPEMKKVLTKAGLHSSDAMGVLGQITSLKDLPSGKEMRTYMRHAAELVESGQRTKSIARARQTASKTVGIPPELSIALKKNKTASKVFENFSRSCRREYAEWVAEAKRPETKQKRVAQAVVWIAENKSRNWKYENC